MRLMGWFLLDSHIWAAMHCALAYFVLFITVFKEKIT